MDKEEREATIRQKCQAAGCNDNAQKRHYQFFVYERWDPHPPDDFREWFLSDQANKHSNPASAWNVDSVRQAFYKSRGSQHAAL